MYNHIKSGQLRYLGFTVVDSIVLQLAFVLSYMVRHGVDLPYFRRSYLEVGLFLFLINVVVVFFDDNHYDVMKRGYLREFFSVIKHITIVIGWLLLYMFMVQSSAILSRAVIIYLWGIATATTYGTHLLCKYLVAKKVVWNRSNRYILVVTDRQSAEEVIETMQASYESGRIIAGLAIIDADLQGTSVKGISVVAGPTDVVQYMKQSIVDEVFISIMSEDPVIKMIDKSCLEMGITVHTCLLHATSFSSDRAVGNFAGYTVLTESMKLTTTGEMFFKRGMDICGGLVGVLMTGLIGMVFAPIIYIQSPGPIFFSQVRIGKNGRRFRIYKFRSMYLDAEERKKTLMSENKMQGFMFKMDDDPRVIPIGRFIRKYSLDEFPQFWNVLKGEMSLVGNCYIIGTTKKNPVFSSVCPIG